MPSLRTLKVFTLTAAFSLFALASAYAGDPFLTPSSISVEGPFLQGQEIRVVLYINNASTTHLRGVAQMTANGQATGVDSQYSVMPATTDENGQLSASQDPVFFYMVPSQAGQYELTFKILAWEEGDDPSNNTVSTTIYVQADFDRDGLTDEVDTDDDNDGVNDEDDVFPYNSSEHTDSDGDGAGDNSDDDDDNDGTPDIQDALPLDPNENKDTDGDGIGDNSDEDIDGDGVSNSEESITLSTDPEDPDSDGDGFDDGNDEFPNDPTEWADLDQDKQGDNFDTDIDGDGIPNEDEVPLGFDPNDPNPIARLTELASILFTNKDILFDASSSEDDSKITSYIWTFQMPDGSSKEVTGEQVNVQFLEAGKIQGTLTVIDDIGQSTTTTFAFRTWNSIWFSSAVVLPIFLLALAIFLLLRYNRRASLVKQENRPNKKAKK